MTLATQLSPSAARQYLLKQAVQQGVELEVYVSRVDSTSIVPFEAEVSEFKLQAQQGVGLRALLRGAWGYSFSENLSASALDRALTDAIENAQLVAPESGAALLAWGPAPALDLHGEGLSGVSVEQKVQVALELEKAARQTDPRVQSVPYAAYQDEQQQLLLGNTAGLEREQQSLAAFHFVSPLVSEAGQNKMTWDWQFSREFSQLDPTRTAQQAVQKSLALLGAKPAPSGRFPAVITGKCMAELLSLYVQLFSGKMVEEGKSILAGRLRQTVASVLVTITDEPLLACGLSSRAFDAEGCPSAPLTLLERGQLLAFMHNQATAARAATQSTGHATRYGYQGTVGVGPSNVVMHSGQTPAPQLYAGLSGFQLTGITGGHAGANLFTGDFSLQAEGFWVEEGEVQHPLEVFTVAGNFLELLGQIEQVGDDSHMNTQGCLAPSVRVPSLAFGGG